MSATAKVRKLTLTPVLDPANANPATNRPDLHEISSRFTQQSLALQYPPPPEVSVFRPLLQVVREADHTVPAELDPEADDDYFERQQTSDYGLPDPQIWSARLTQAIMEIRAGRRPLHQVSRWTSHEVYQRIAGEVARLRAGDPQPYAVSGLRVTRPANGVAEVSAVLVGRQRSRAIALRLEGWDGRWLCTELAVI